MLSAIVAPLHFAYDARLELQQTLPLGVLLLIMGFLVNSGAAQAVGTVTTLLGNTSAPVGFADGVGASAAFFNPNNIALNAAGTSGIIVSSFDGACFAREIFSASHRLRSP